MNKTLLAAAAAVVFAGADGAPYAVPAAFAQTAANPWAGLTDTGLTDAITKIERASGGKVLEIRFSNRNGVVGYDAVVAKGAVISSMTIAAAPAALAAVVAEADLPAWQASWKLRADARSVEKAKLSLPQAVAIAEKVAGAPAVAARLAKPLTGDNTVLAYNVEVLKGGKPERLAIDATTGAPIENPDALYDPWTPSKAFLESLKKA